MQEQAPGAGTGQKFYQIELMHNRPLEALLYDPNPKNKQRAARKVVEECHAQIAQSLEERPQKPEHTYDLYDRGK